MPLISVVVPVYKVQPYIRSCVDSLLAQTFDNIEIILIDDGSPDDCGAICDEYSLADGRVRVIHKENGGLSRARNTGVEAARGEYVCFVDSDDYVSPDYCKTLFDMLDGTEYDFSFCGVCRFEDGTEPECTVCERTYLVTNAEYVGMQLKRKTEFGVWNKLFRRELFGELRFAPGKINEDVIFSADLLKSLGNGAIGSEQQLYFYRMRNGGIVSETAKKGHPDRIYAGEYLLEAVRAKSPEYLDVALHYAVDYPWMFVDPMYVHGDFSANRVFAEKLQKHLHKYLCEYKVKKIFDETLLKRMTLFSKSRFLYAFNAYARLFRVYLYRILRKDAYSDGHGI